MLTLGSLLANTSPVYPGTNEDTLARRVRRQRAELRHRSPASMVNSATHAHFITSSPHHLITQSLRRSVSPSVPSHSSHHLTNSWHNREQLGHDACESYEFQSSRLTHKLMATNRYLIFTHVRWIES